ncbi:MAG: hypothetical protein AB1601_03675 [Planctomycetota bacterium]
MPLQWFAGFEAADFTEVVTVSGATVGAAYKRSGGYGCRLTVPTGTTLINIAVGNGYDANGNPTTISRTAYTIGFGLRVIALPQTNGQWEHLVFIGSGATHRASLRLGSDGTLRLHLGTVGSPHLASFGPIQLNRWYFCELVVLSDRYVWRMDGSVVAHGLGGPGGSMNVAYLGKRYNLASQGYTVEVDDVYTCDDATMFGPTVRVARLNANVNGSQFGWTPYPSEPPPEAGEGA